MSIPISAEKIVARARELNIVLWVEGGHLRVKGSGAVPPKMVDVLKANKAVLLAYLAEGNQEAIKRLPENEIFNLDLCAPLPDRNALDLTQDLPDVCSTCGGEVEWYSDDGRAYCAEHMPGTIPTFCTNHGSHDPLTDHVVHTVSSWFDVQTVEVIPMRSLDEWKAQVLREYQDRYRRLPSIKRAPILQYIADCVERGEMPDHWVILKTKLARFDPAHSVDWSRYGYQRGHDGRWHATSSDYWLHEAGQVLQEGSNHG